MNENYNSPEKLKAARQSLHATQEELAEVLDYRRTHWNQIETGKLAIPATVTWAITGLLATGWRGPKWVAKQSRDE